MTTNMLAKARNLIVNITLRSCDTKFIGKLIDYDDGFAEIIVKVDPSSGTFARDKAAFNDTSGKWNEERVLVNISDISTIY